MQAAVLTAIEEFRCTSSSTTLQQARSEAAYGPLLSKVATVVSAQPLSYLQNFGGITDPFLYQRPGRGIVVLKPNVSYCLRRFHPLVQHLARNHWVGHVKANRRNHGILGDAGDLEDFLFGISRQSLSIIGAGLRKLDGPRCFYCGQGLHEADVDHFVPFALYPRNLVHNFVLAHPECNRSKSDSLAGKVHLARWLDRLTARSPQLAEIGAVAGVVTDEEAAHRVAAWGYGNAHAAQGRAWVKASNYEVIDLGYLQRLASP
ncbi:HNH endonuclease [Variovorax sp. RA8]|uniref:HNH endonuclease n=1 Tax=Variovorax sp. (strain JCM 16519 / RA8) TaxID=662548 RepID=UPI001E62B674|nr:HNH endonuclease [Variovorax sp. RA8]